MENNLIYNGTSIFTNKPHIYLNLNTSITKNLNVFNYTNLNHLTVNNYSRLKGQLSTDNVFINGLLDVTKNTILQSTLNVNKFAYFNDTTQSTNYDSGALTVKGGVGIARNLFVKGNTTIQENLNITNDVNITNDLNVNKNLNVTNFTNIHQNLNVFENTNIHKNLNVFSNININDDLNVYKNSNIFQYTTIHKNLNVKSNIITSDNVFIHNKLIVDKNVVFKENLSIKGNLILLGSKLEAITETITLGDPLLIIGTNQSKSSDIDGLDQTHGGFLIGHNKAFSGLLRTPNTHNFHLLRDIPNNNETPDLTILNNYASLFLHNINSNNTKTNFLHITGNTLIQSNLNVLQDINIKQNLDVTKFTTIHQNLNVKEYTLSNNLIVDTYSRLKGQLTTDNVFTTGTLTVDKNTTLKKSLDVNKFLRLHDTTESHTHNDGVLVVSGGVGISKNTNIGGNTNISNNLKVYQNTNLLRNLIVKGNSLIQSNLNVLQDTNIKENLDVSQFTTIHQNLNVKKYTLSNNIIIDTYSRLKGQTTLDQVFVTENLIVDKNTTLKKSLFLNNTIDSDNYNNGSIISKGGIGITKNLNVGGNVTINNDLNVLKNINTPIIINKNLNIYGNTTFHNNVTINHNLNVTKGVHFSDDLEILGNLVVRGNHAVIVTKQLDVNDPIITISNINTGIYRDKGLLIKTHDLGFSGLIRKDMDKQFYLIDKVSDPNLLDIPVENKSTLILQNINTTQESFIFGASFLSNNDNTDKNDVIAHFPNNTSSPHINFYKPTKFNENLIVDSNLNVNGNIAVTDQFVLLDTNSLLAKGSSKFFGKTQLFGDTEFSGSINFLNNISAFKADSLNIRSYIHSSNNLYSKNIDTNYLKVTDNIIIPNNNGNNPKLTKIPGSIFFNTSSNMFEGYNNEQWLPLGGINPYTDTHITNNLNIDFNLNVGANINVNDTITSNINIVLNNLKIPVGDGTDPLLTSEKGTIFYNITNRMFEGHNGTRWAPLGGINPYKDTTIINNLNVVKNLNVIGNININNTITSNINLVKDVLVIPRHDGTNSKISNTIGSIFFNTTTSMYEGYDGNLWAPLGGISPYKDTNIVNNLNVEHKTNLDSLKVNGISNFKGFVHVENSLSSEELLVPCDKSTNNNGALFIQYNNTDRNLSKLLLRLNNIDNVIPFNNNPVTHLSVSTDLFQFYNVQLNNTIFGNRVTGLNDPAFNSFTKFYIIKEYTFFQETFLNNIEFYTSHSIYNNDPSGVEDLTITIEIYKNGDMVTDLTNFNLTPGETNRSPIPEIEFINGDKLTLKLRLTGGRKENGIITDGRKGHEIFARLYGFSKISPVINQLHLTSTHDYNASGGVPALKVNGGATFGGSIEVTGNGKFIGTVSEFTGGHISKLVSQPIYNTYYIDNTHLKSGLIVSVVNSSKISIDNSVFDIKLSNSYNDKTVFGVINKYYKDSYYIVNSLGEGAIWVSNINGDIQNGDYITTSNISGYGCLQSTNQLCNYTVAKCCSNINWNNITTFIDYNRNQYKIAFIACTYHSG